MAVLEALSLEEMYLVALLQDSSGVDIAEFLWKDPDQPDNLFRCYDYQYPWYRNDAKQQIDQCVAEGELVLTRRGQVPIEHVRVGDEVWTHQNRWRKVTYTWDKGVQEVVRVTNPGNNAGLLVTPDHKMWTRGGTRRMVAGVRTMHPTDPEFRAPQDFASRSGEQYATMLASPWDFGQDEAVPEVTRLPGCSRHTIPEINDDFMWLCGIYVAEGCVATGQNTVLSVHESEAELVAKMARKSGLRPMLIKTANPKVINVTLGGQSLATWFVEHFGKLAHGKKLPTWALGLPEDARQALLDGLIFGDGHTRNTRRDPTRTSDEYTTVSKALAYDVRLLAQSLGRGASVGYSRRAGTMQIQGRTVTRDTYVVSLHVRQSKKNRVALVDEHVWAAHHGVVPAGLAHVYDIEVEEDHSFVANGQVQSNCARAIGKSVGIQMRAFAFPYVNPGNDMLITAPEMIHLDPVTKNIEDRLMSTRLSREMLKSGNQSSGITHRPFEAKFRNDAKIVGRIPQKDGKGVKGQHPRILEMDEAQDYPAAGWIELVETLRFGDDTSRWRAHGVSRGVRDHYYKLSQSSDWFVHRISAMHRPDWTDQERKSKAELYGSKEHPDYRRNILGLHGDAMSSLFVLHRLMACFIGQTKIRTPVGAMPISALSIGDEVLNSAGTGLVTNVIPSLRDRLIRVDLDNGESFYCTPEHPWLTGYGWTNADNLQSGDELVGHREAVRLVWGAVSEQESSSVLRQDLRREVAFGDASGPVATDSHTEALRVVRRAVLPAGTGHADRRMDARARVVSVAVLEPGSDDFDRLACADGEGGHVRVYDISVSGHPSFVIGDAHAVVHNCVDSREDSDYNANVYTHIRINDEWLRDSGMPIEALIDLPGSHKTYKRVWIGMDVGMTNHPSEILVFGAEAMPGKRAGEGGQGERIRCLTRIHLERIGTHDQIRVMDMLADFYRPLAFGMDRTGLGLPIFNLIQTNNGVGHNLHHAIRGYNFSEKIPVGFEPPPEDENEWTDPMDRAIMGNVLEFSSDQLRLMVDQAKLVLPWDIDMLREFQGQAYYITKSATNPYGKKEFNKGKFHALDAARMAALAYSQEYIEKQLALQPEQSEVMLTWLDGADYAASGGYGGDPMFSDW